MAPERKPTNQQHRQRAAADSTAAGPAARTRAAVRQQQHQQQQHAFGMVLPLLLQHDSVRTRLRLVCSMLCCSKAVAAAVAEHCAGQLDIRGSASFFTTMQVAAWLRKHARLVRSLHLPGGSAEYLSAMMAAGPQSLQLQSLKASCSSSTLLLLEQLPAHRLTHLDCLAQSWSHQPQDLPAFVARLSAALGRLTGLRALELWRPADGSLELPGLSGLTQLTSLRYGGPVSDLQHAPPQLLELELPWWKQQPLELSRLTAVTALTCLDVKEDDVLPVNLQSLHVSGNCRSVQPLLGLQRLQQLDACFHPIAEVGTDITADQLQQLSSLSALSLDYEDYESDAIEPASAAAWPLLPLQRLELRSASLSAAVCQSLGQLTGLTSLQLERFEMPHAAASAQQLAAAAALRQLSGLQQLQLCAPRLQPDDAAIQQLPEGMRQLVQAISSLQQLRGLDITFFRPHHLLRPAAAGPGNSWLTALTGITSLLLINCDLDDAHAASIVAQLPLGLQSLNFGGNTQLTDVVLPAIGRLTQLTNLLLYGTRVTDSGLLHLTGLVRLRKLKLCGTRISNAGMHHLTGLTQLQELIVPYCVSAQQQRWLQQQLPDLVSCRAAGC